MPRDELLVLVGEITESKAVLDAIHLKGSWMIMRHFCCAVRMTMRKNPAKAGTTKTPVQHETTRISHNQG